ncbi:UDP-N-acetylmuramyl pentapeptide phosphotransferase [Brevibacillus migulae]|uniref:UDP-N-acetylmuramyl pentapeptide phosphotransferase n=1 Tax=Brevibacillus migulae TaxID=1644114 RepID=UPI00106EFBFF|nr:UDP-N-acetylmuramyl pentapeptide phosphotransferase [Brevibacillus migulae]
MGVILFAAAITPILLHALVFRRGRELLIRKGVVRSNYAGRVIPTAGGVFFSLYYITAVGVAASVAYQGHFAELPLMQATLLFSGMLTASLLGWLDDRSADKEAKGFRGHLAVLWQEGRMTSGLWKAWGGGAVSMLVALPLSGNLSEWLIHTGILSLSMNLLNLFDLRPGRAMKVFWIFLILSATSAWHVATVYLWMVPGLMATLLLFRPEGRQQIMLGDTGANSLGFLTGFLLVLTQSLTAKICLLILLVILHGLAEFISFSRVIQSVGWLRRIDQWGRQSFPQNDG